PFRVSIAEIEKAAEKAAEIANQLALFSLDDKNKRSQIAGNLNVLIRRSVQLFQTPDREGIIWSLQFENKLYSASFDEAKMQQAFVKILENAVEALDNRGGQISIETRNLELSETILFVDDEEMVARLALMVLSSLGYRVMTAHDGEQALEVFARSNGKIDLLITDMVMPHMNGRELIEKVRALFPATRIICSTACVRSLESDTDLNYLQKPF